MVKTKNKPGKACCCSDCAVRPGLSDDARECCYCVSDQLCVHIEIDSDTVPAPCDASFAFSGDDCDCFDEWGSLTWDDVNCWWDGDVTCGSTTIDFRVQIKKISGVCKVCVTSTCLDMGGSGSDCFALNTCGDYNDGGLTSGDGFTLSFTGDLSSGCGNNDCSDATITITAQNIINPQPVSEMCPDCDCVCECVCLTYTADGCSEVQKACWDGSKFQATFNGDCSWSSQVATITLVKEDGCCNWNLATSRGTVAIARQSTGCPRPDITWNLTSPTATLTMECTECGDDCPVQPACCLPAETIPLVIYARICEGTCDLVCAPLTLVSVTSTNILWKGPATIECTQQPDGCDDYDIEIEVECIDSGKDGTIWDVNIHCDGSLAIQASGGSSNCDPLCLTRHFGLGPGTSPCSTYACDSASAGYDVCISEEPCP